MVVEALGGELPLRRMIMTCRRLVAVARSCKRPAQRRRLTKDVHPCLALDFYWLYSLLAIRRGFRVFTMNDAVEDTGEAKVVDHGGYLENLSVVYALYSILQRIF